MRAFCFASGHIEFGNRIPAGALPIASGPEKKLRPYIEVMARHGYSTRVVKGRTTKIPGTDTLLVPGVPEAPDQDAALEAFQNWLRWISQHAPTKVDVFSGGRR